MLPAFLITFREVIEASLIVATILGILVKLKQKKAIKTVWLATSAAGLLSLALLVVGAIFGLKIQEAYSGKTEELIEGILMITSAIFITWAVFFLHKYFAQQKVKLLQKVKKTVAKQEQQAIFALVFTAVFREGFEIVLFLTTIYFSTNPQAILTGFSLGTVAGLLVSFGLFSATLRLPIYQAFRATSILLILFAAGLLARGVHEFAELGYLPEIVNVTFTFIPPKATVTGSILKAIFGITQKMDLIQIITYTIYVTYMSWYIFLKNKVTIQQSSNTTTKDY